MGAHKTHSSNSGVVEKVTWSSNIGYVPVYVEKSPQQSFRGTPLYFDVSGKGLLQFVIALCCLNCFQQSTDYSYTRLKNIKNVKGCRDGMPKSMQTR